MSSLLERLGRRPDSRLVIVSVDRIGSCHAANVGGYEALRAGWATSGTLMVPCAWSRHASHDYRGEDLGVALTLNAELDLLRWGPITQAPSLLDGDGGFPRTVHDLWDHGDLDEVRRECRAQLERAVLWGFDVTHLASHLSVMAMRPEFFDVYLELALEFDLPVRLPSAEHERSAGFPFRRLAHDEGVLSPDRVIALARPDREALESVLFDLEPGVTELVLCPAADTPELRALDTDWAARIEAAELLVHDSSARALVDRAGAERIGYRELRTAQRHR